MTSPSMPPPHLQVADAAHAATKAVNHLITNTGIADAPPIYLLPVTLIITMILAYLIGSIPFGVLLAKIYKVGDLRQIGSGNIGATNMLRAGGRNLAIATLTLDMAKGYIAVLVCETIMQIMLKGRFTSSSGITVDINQLHYFFGFYAVVGHVWPIWLNYKGGKGVATALGALLAFSLPVGMLAMACWLVAFSATQISSLSALVSVFLAPFLCYYYLNKSAAIATLLIMLVVFFRHKDNIKRLLQGTEPKSNLKKEKA